MKYKKGDTIRVKSKKWWERQPKTSKVTGKMEKSNLYFPEQMADDCCGMIDEILGIDDDDDDDTYCIIIKNKIW